MKKLESSVDKNRINPERNLISTVVLVAFDDATNPPPDKKDKKGIPYTERVCKFMFNKWRAERDDAIRFLTVDMHDINSIYQYLNLPKDVIIKRLKQRLLTEQGVFLQTILEETRIP